MMKNKTKVIVWSIIAAVCVLVLSLCSLIFFGINDYRHNDSYSRNGINKFVISSENEILDNIENIDVEWAVGDVELFVGNTDKIKIIEKSGKRYVNDSLISIDVSGNKLKINDGYSKDNKFNFNLFKNHTSRNLEIYMPQKLYEEIVLNVISGDLDFNMLNSKTLECNSVSGDIKGNNIVVNNFKLDGVSADTELSGELNNFDANVVSGDIDLYSNVMIDKVSVSTTSGDVDISIPDNDGFIVNFNKVSGDVESDFPLTKLNNQYTYKNGTSVFNIESISADVEINNINN